MNATSVTCADEDDEDYDDDGEAADMEGSTSFSPNCKLPDIVASVWSVYFQSMRKVAFWKQMR